MEADGGGAAAGSGSSGSGSAPVRLPGLPPLRASLRPPPPSGSTFKMAPGELRVTSPGGGKGTGGKAERPRRRAGPRRALSGPRRPASAPSRGTRSRDPSVGLVPGRLGAPVSPQGPSVAPPPSWLIPV